MVAYAPTPEAPEGQKTSYLAALNSTVASVPARAYVFVLTDANARTGKIWEEGGEAGSKVLGAYIWPRRVQRKRQTTAGFRRIQQARSSERFLLHSKSGLSYTFQSANRNNKGQECWDYIVTKKAARRLISCVDVRRPPFDAPEPDHNLVYARVRILRRLMADPNLRCQVANAMVAALPPIPDSTCISDIATDMVDAMLSTAA